jgi:hypothetical protein
MKKNKQNIIVAFTGSFFKYKVNEKPLIAKYYMKAELKLCDLPHATTHNTFVNTTCLKERNNLSHVAG